MSEAISSEEHQDNSELPQEELALEGAGQKLRAERQRQNMTLEMVAAETRIPQRHLGAIENGDFDALPARTYAIGFSRTYAKLLGMDDKAIVQEVREEIAVHSPEDRRGAAKFEPGDPARVPSRGVAWAGVLAAILLIAGGFMFYRNIIAPGAGPGSLIAQQGADEAAAELAATEQSEAGGSDRNGANADGQVVFTSLEEGIWVRFYDAQDSVLKEGMMAKGETFAVPQGADTPQIRTGRPDAFSITIAGTPVAKLSEDDFVMKDQGVDAATLLARAETAPAAVPAADAGN